MDDSSVINQDQIKTGVVQLCQHVLLDWRWNQALWCYSIMSSTDLFEHELGASDISDNDPVSEIFWS